MPNAEEAFGISHSALILQRKFLTYTPLARSLIDQVRGSDILYSQSQ